MSEPADAAASHLDESTVPGPAALALAFVAVAVVWSVAEVALRSGTASALLTALGAGAALGLLHGLMWTAMLRGPSRLSQPWPAVVHAAGSIALGLWLTSSLGAWAKLGTRNNGLALAAIGAGVLLASIVYLGCRLFSWRDLDHRARWLGMSARAQRMLATVLVLGAISASWIDRSLFVGLHPVAHSCLRAATLAGLAFAGTVLAPRRARAPRSRSWLGLDTVALGLALVAAAVPFATLRGAADPALAAIWATPLTDESIGTLRRLTDLDGDGFSGVLGGGDCDPLDPEVSPGATEIPGNGVDDNCTQGDTLATLVDLEATPTPTTASPRSVLLITVETLRADHMGLYGYARDTTPQIDAWSRDARVYDRAFSAGAWTSIAIPTLLRGVNARRLLWQPWAETNKGRLFRAGESVALVADEQGVQTFMLPDGGAPPLGWWLQRRGMTTAAVVDDRFSELLDASVGTAAGFEVFVDADQIRGRDPDDQVVDLALQTLAGLPEDRRFFLWVHLFGPHSPNTTHAGVPSFGDTLLDGYDHEIRFADEQIGRLLQGATLRDPELVWIVTADHGEVLLADDRMHGFDLSESVIRVPLVVGGTPAPAGREPAVVSTIDLVPTILALTETPAPAYLDGRDLLAGPAADARLVLVDTWHRRFDGSLLFDQVAVTDGTIEMVLDITKNAWGLVDLTAPSRAPQSIAAQHDTGPMRAAIRAYLEASPLQVDPVTAVH